MATQFTDMFLSMKKRDLESQIMLVKGLRILCDVLLVRNKASKANASAKTLLRERKKLTSLVKSSDSMSLSMMRPIMHPLIPYQSNRQMKKERLLRQTN